MRATLPGNESERLSALHRYGIVGTNPEREFDGLARTAATLFQVPFALVSFVDKESQWLKSHIGIDICETHRDVAFCAHAILQTEPTVVINPAEDPRFADNPLVTGPPGVRFYVGVPLITKDGLPIGTLCVIDTVQRERPRPSDICVLQDLARQVVDQLEFRLARKQLVAYATELEQKQREMERLLSERSGLLNCVPTGVLGVNRAGLCTFLNPRAEELLDVREREWLGRSVHELLHIAAEGGSGDPVTDTLESGLEIHSDSTFFRSQSGNRFPVDYHASPLVSEGAIDGVVISFVDVSERKRQEAERAEILRQLDSAVRDLGRVQRGMLQARPEISDLKVDLCLHPKHAAGGDFLCQHRLPDGRDVLLLTDVSGHDLRAAYYSAYSHGMVRAMLDRGVPLDGIFAGINRDLLHKSSEDGAIAVAVSASAIMYDSKERKLSVLSAGSPSPIYVDEDGLTATLIVGSSQPLGWFDPPAIESVQRTLSRGFLLIWTDGLEELSYHVGVTPLTLAVTLLRARAGQLEVPCLARAQDDVMAAAVRFPGDARDILERWIPLLDEQYTRDMLPHIDQLQERWSRNLEFAIPGLRDASLFDVLLCCREAVLNGLNHGCANGGVTRLAIRYNIAESSVAVRVSDPGAGHDFDMEMHTGDELFDLHRGLFLIRQFAHRLWTDRNGATINMEFNLWATSLDSARPQTNTRLNG